MKLRKIAAATVIAALAVGVGASAASADTGTTTCTYPAWVENAPHVANGVTLWHDATGWHVRVKHPTLHDRVFSGVIHTSGEFSDLTKVRTERNDSVKLAADQHTIAFRLNNYGHVDGFDFQTSCAPRVDFLFVTDGHRVPTRDIAIGSTARHPANNPFVISRQP
jgi:hypothetical protein